MTSLKIASKSSQVKTFPSLLVAKLAQAADDKVKIEVSFEEVDVLDTKESVEFSTSSGLSFVGSAQVLNGLYSTYAFLRGGNDDLVFAALY